MPRITISEKDLTVDSNIDVAENIVYVPGISVAGPLNTPTVCRSIADFKETFGDSPYRFISDQIYNGETVASANDYEISYIYACELLTAGLTVLFERVIDPEQHLHETTTITAQVEAVTQESYAPDTYYLINQVTVATQDAFEAGTFYTYDAGVYTLAEVYDNSATYYTITLDNSAEWSDAKTYYAISTDTAITGDEEVVEAFYTALLGDGTNLSVFNKLQDSWTYQLKFITAGGYDTVGITQGTDDHMPFVEMMSIIAAVRGDAIALLDHGKSVTSIMDVYDQINLVADNQNLLETTYTLLPIGNTVRIDNIEYKLPTTRKAELALKYGAIFTPWAQYIIRTPHIQVLLADNSNGLYAMPGSFGYLLSLANSITTYDSPDYYAIAGVVRGLVPHFNSSVIDVTGAEAEAVQDRERDHISINPIVNVQGYGHCIWGNRSLYPNISTASHPDGDLAASSFLNIRVMAADVKKVVYAACKKYTFETNSTELWLKFKSEVEPLLDQMIADNALVSYEMIKQSTTERATLSVYIKLVTQYAVEDFDITIGLTDSTVEDME